MKFVRHGIHQVCPGVVNSLGTPRSGNRPTPGQGTRMNRIPDLGTCMARSAVMPGATVGNKSQMPHEMLLRDSESTVHRIKILMLSQSGDYISRESNPGFHGDLSV